MTKDMTSLGAQTVKRLPTMRETWVPSLGQGDALEKEMAIHSSTFAWDIPWTEKPGGPQSRGLQRVGHNQAHIHTYTKLKNMQYRYQRTRKGTVSMREAGEIV